MNKFILFRNIRRFLFGKSNFFDKKINSIPFTVFVDLFPFMWYNIYIGTD